MKTYHPTPDDKILPEYTDERLRSGTGYGRHVADVLLTIPAAYRQPCEAEVTSRTTVTHRTVNGPMLKHVADLHATRKIIVAEIQEQLGL